VTGRAALAGAGAAICNDLTEILVDFLIIGFAAGATGETAGGRTYFRHHPRTWASWWGAILFGERCFAGRLRFSSRSNTPPTRSGYELRRR